MFPREPGNTPIIAQHVSSCLHAFRVAIKSLAEADLQIQGKIPPGALTDAMGRFQIWSANIGAHQKGRSSLDHRLRETSHVRDRVIDLLRNQLVVVGEAIEIINGNLKPWEDMSDSDSDSDSGASTIYAEADIICVSTELAQLVSNMAEINTCLMRLSMAIRTPAPHDQFMQSKGIRVSHFEVYDIEHVRGKFPNSPDYLLARLGKAISRRRQYLRYREEHRQRLGQGLDTSTPLPAAQLEDVPSQSTPASTIAISQQVESTLASPLPANIQTVGLVHEYDEETYSEGFHSQTTYASTTPDMTKLRPPMIPDSALQGDPFECALCKRVTVVRHMKAWHKHVYRDLKPYVSPTIRTILNPLKR